MADESDGALKKSLDRIDNLRRRVLISGWMVVAATLVVYARLAYLHRTSDNLEVLLGASVAALTCVIAWTALAIIVIITRSTKSILRAIDLAARRAE